MIIIPARVHSSRFPKKVLADILGLPMVVRVANRAREVDDVVVATDSSEVTQVCDKYGIKSFMTDINHQSGTDRIAEVAMKLGLRDDEKLINLQADEPFIEKEVLELIVAKTNDIKEDIFMSSCFTRMDKVSAMDSNNVKLVVDNDGKAMYFSRSLIPFDRDESFNDYLLHLGIYGFNVASLKVFCEMKKSFLEEREKLEQLRWIENGYDIFMQEVKTKSFGIDTKEDLAKAIRIFK